MQHADNFTVTDDSLSESYNGKEFPPVLILYRHSDAADSESAAGSCDAIVKNVSTALTSIPHHPSLRRNNHEI
ncbi:MAG: hypothetical protein IT314_14980 [Anaerolineales bacterium]|nr:hypothetical protein [Anaerolineales bacterium]